MRGPASSAIATAMPAAALTNPSRVSRASSPPVARFSSHCLAFSSKKHALRGDHLCGLRSGASQVPAGITKVDLAILSFRDKSCQPRGPNCVPRTTACHCTESHGTEEGSKNAGKTGPERGYPTHVGRAQEFPHARNDGLESFDARGAAAAGARGNARHRPERARISARGRTSSRSSGTSGTSCRGDRPP